MPPRKASDPGCTTGRTVIAKTCLACMQLLPISKFNATAKSARCMRCENNYHRGRETADQRLRRYRHANARSAARNRELRTHATRHRFVWTGPEMELLARADLSESDLARMLGRTAFAVSHKRRALRRMEPVAVYLAGQPTKNTMPGEHDG